MTGSIQARVWPALIGMGLLALAACAPTDEMAQSSAPLSLDFVWPTPSEPAPPLWPNSATPPQAVILRWNPEDYSAKQIAQIAGQQCVSFGRRAVAAGGISSDANDRSERFTCAFAAQQNHDTGRG